MKLTKLSGDVFWKSPLLGEGLIGASNFIHHVAGKMANSRFKLFYRGVNAFGNHVVIASESAPVGFVEVEL